MEVIRSSPYSPLLILDWTDIPLHSRIFSRPVRPSSGFLGQKESSSRLHPTTPCDTMTPAELLKLAHGGSDQAFDALQESLPLRQDPVKWDIFDQSTYPPLVCENGAEADMVNGVVPPQKRKRRGRSAKTSAHPPVDDAISPHSGGNDNAKRMRLGSPIGEISIPMADSRSVRFAAHRSIRRAAALIEVASLPSR